MTAVDGLSVWHASTKVVWNDRECTLPGIHVERLEKVVAQFMADQGEVDRVVTGSLELKGDR
jgi:hypothetical protein